MSDTPRRPSASPIWSATDSTLSLPEVHGTIPIPLNAGFWRKFFAFAGPGLMVAVGCMDPGNWATDLAGEPFRLHVAEGHHDLELMAILLQALAARLGLGSGRDLAQACRDTYPMAVVVVLYIRAEIGITACDLAEVIGSAIALKLLFGIPMLYGVCLTAVDVLVLLSCSSRAFETSKPSSWSSWASSRLAFWSRCGFATRTWRRFRTASSPQRWDTTGHALHRDRHLGATVMPHNLYRHSALVQTRMTATRTCARRSSSPRSTPTWPSTSPS